MIKNEIIIKHVLDPMYLSYMYSKTRLIGHYLSGFYDGSQKIFFTLKDSKLPDTFLGNS